MLRISRVINIIKIKVIFMHQLKRVIVAGEVTTLIRYFFKYRTHFIDVSNPTECAVTNIHIECKKSDHNCKFDYNTITYLKCCSSQYNITSKIVRGKIF